ncbi:hypothetical protein Ciccas_002673 [Cichlidogyrus casuarinus]|uniref:Ig-like domain-containing protein n=1 Tax=Cichlidogyrus casuarinus TaxID=1844966 RepID=A0ABD2QGJ5_9PLAT
MVCRADASPHPEFQWTFKGIPLFEDGRVSISQDKYESRLTVKDGSKADAGEYSCLAANEAGSANGTIHAIFISKPKIISLELEKITPIEGDSQKILCAVEGEPKPNIKWELNGMTVCNHFCCA